MSKAKTKEHYVNNREFYEAMVVHKQGLIEGNDPRVGKNFRYIGECIFKICNRLAFRPNFVNYSYRDEMVEDAVENCCAAIDNFNPEKSNNPFAYFTMIAKNAMIRRILKEKKESYVKYKTYYNSLHNDMLVEGGGGAGYGELMDHEYGANVIRSFEERIETSKKKTKKGLEAFAVDKISD